MDKQHFKISKMKGEDEISVTDFIAANWGSAITVSKGKVYNPARLPGFICWKDDKIIGLITYNVVNNECEIVTLNSKINDQGLGSELIRKIIDVAKEHDCKRVWVITNK